MRPRSAACTAMTLLVLGGCGGNGRKEPVPTVAPAPGPIIGGQPTPAPRDPLSPGDRRAAAASVRRFLSGYLPYLYGRGPARRVAPVTPSVQQALRAGSARVTPAQRRRRPRVAGLEVIGQTPRSALAAVRVADGGPAEYQLTLTVERRDGRWVISDLGDDG
jgi:hypothetical protein